jgi:hypothetical protein
MSIEVYDARTRTTGWYQPADGALVASVAGRSGDRGEALYRDRAGQWVISVWSRYADEATRGVQVPDDGAHLWLLLHDPDIAAQVFPGRDRPTGLEAALAAYRDGEHENDYSVADWYMHSDGAAQ